MRDGAEHDRRSGIQYPLYRRRLNVLKGQLRCQLAGLLVSRNLQIRRRRFGAFGAKSLGGINSVDEAIDNHDRMSIQQKVSSIRVDKL